MKKFKLGRLEITTEARKTTKQEKIDWFKGFFTIAMIIALVWWGK